MKKNSIYLLVFSIVFIFLVQFTQAADVSITRDLPTTAKKGSTISITLSVNVDESKSIPAVGISEPIPTYLTVANAGGGQCKSNSIEWILAQGDLYNLLVSGGVTQVLPLADRNITYTLNIPKTYSGTTITFLQTNVSITNGTSDFSGDSIITISGLMGDTDNDGDVDFTDLRRLASAYGSSAGDPLYNSAADFNDDGKVNFSDLRLLAANYG